MPTLLLMFLLAWLAAPAAGQAAPAPGLATAAAGGTSAPLSPAQAARALDDLTSDDGDRREAAITMLGSSGDPKWLAFLAALRDGQVYARTRGGKTEILMGGRRTTQGDHEVIELIAPYDGAPRGVAPAAALKEVAADRRLRIAIKPFLDADETKMQLADPDPDVRRSAAVKLGNQARPASAPVIEEALRRESDRWVRHALAEALALIRLNDAQPAARVEAARALGDLHSTTALPALRALAADAAAPPPLRAAASRAVSRIERWAMLTATVETLFQGASLASILLLMALGLAIVFGLMGVINMAHGELMALGAYATFVVQNWFRAAWPDGFDYYLVAALPVAFGVAAVVGLALERGVIRRLYGRPLETLLLTWGASLIIQQGLRLWFGAANVDVVSPRWLSGGVSVMVNLTLPYNRVFIIGLAAVAVAAMYGLLFRTGAGLRIRAVTQNRAMAACLGVRAGRVDAATFAVGAGLAGLAGSALTQIGNVGPSLGQNYIVDSFMVVVTGGVGKLAGTILAAAGIGGLNKGIEPALGAVFAKVAILVVVILFLQRRPAGLFAPRGRHAEA